jgi:hypothetical protein
MGKPQLQIETIEKIKSLRMRGFSLPEIKRELKIGHGSVFRYIKGVEILPEYQEYWEQKRKPSIFRKKNAEILAGNVANNLILSVSKQEKAIFLSALYWGEGSKKDLNFMNSDPEMIKTFITGFRDVFDVTYDRIRVSIRIYDDLDKYECLAFWSDITGIPSNEFLKVEVKTGKKFGKLPYGMCRVRILKGSLLLKTIKAIKDRTVTLFNASP